MPEKATTRFDWPNAAARLATLIPRERLDPLVRQWLESAPPRGVWSVAFSGGPDSLALLLLLWAHWPERQRRLQALHFDHRLRGRESRADAAFCRRVCAALGVKFVTGAWRALPRDVSEAAARAVRMAFLARHGRVVFLGHQQDDIAESMLMRLARGSGTGGLAAPRPVQKLPRRRVHLRPLLGVKKAEIVRALERAGVAWREDSTNAGRTFLRNRIRHTVIKAWAEAAERDAVAGAARSRLLLEEDDDALEAWLDQLDTIGPRGRLNLPALAGKPRALLRRALHRWLLAQPETFELSRQAFDAILASVELGRRTRHSVGRGGFAVLDGDELRFERVGKRKRSFPRRPN